MGSGVFIVAPQPGPGDLVVSNPPIPLQKQATAGMTGRCGGSTKELLPLDLLYIVGSSRGRCPVIRPVMACTDYAGGIFMLHDAHMVVENLC